VTVGIFVFNDQVQLNHQFMREIFHVLYMREEQNFKVGQGIYLTKLFGKKKPNYSYRCILLCKKTG